MKIFSKNKKQGFLLIEMIVSVAIFSIVMTIGVGSLLSMISASRKSQNFKIVINNLNLAIESMSRDIRTGYNYDCSYFGGGDCVNGGNTIYFKSKNNLDTIYRLSDNSIEKSVDGSPFIKITANDVLIDNLNFYVLGSDPSDTTQSKVIVVVQGHSSGQVKESVNFSLQTLISQRMIGF